MVSESQKRAKEKWDRANVKQVKFNLYPSDQELIDHIAERSAVEGKAAFFRRIVRKDMEDAQQELHG